MTFQTIEQAWAEFCLGAVNHGAVPEGILDLTKAAFFIGAAVMWNLQGQILDAGAIGMISQEEAAEALTALERETRQFVEQECAMDKPGSIQ